MTVEDLEKEMTVAADVMIEQISTASKTWVASVSELAEKYSDLPEHLVLAVIQHQQSRMEEAGAQLEKELSE